MPNYQAGAVRRQQPSVTIYVALCHSYEQLEQWRQMHRINRDNIILLRSLEDIRGRSQFVLIVFDEWSQENPNREVLAQQVLRYAREVRYAGNTPIVSRGRIVGWTGTQVGQEAQEGQPTVPTPSPTPERLQRMNLDSNALQTLNRARAAGITIQITEEGAAGTTIQFTEEGAGTLRQELEQLSSAQRRAAFLGTFEEPSLEVDNPPLHHMRQYLRDPEGGLHDITAMPMPQESVERRRGVPLVDLPEFQPDPNPFSEHSWPSFETSFYPAAELPAAISSTTEEVSIEPVDPTNRK